jgi:signal transduction histidine kinase
MEDRQSLNILAVDDLEANLVVYDDLFVHMDARLLKARSANEALELLLEHDIALALIDVHMPEMDGFELAELMRGSKRTRHVPIIFITAGMEDQRRAFKGYDLGAVDFLFKPIDTHILHTKVGVFVELQRQRRQLQETLRLNEELVAVVSHDLRNPLNLITVAVALLSATSEPSIVATAHKIARSTRRMATILDDLVDLSRARLGGGIGITTAECELASIAATVVDELSTSSDGTEAEIVVKPRGELRGVWDGGRLQQVMSNLLANALSHGPTDSVVTLSLDGSRSERLEISVHNQGTIPKEVQANLFEPFSGASRTKARPNGATSAPSRERLGLGLYIVNQIVQAHGGTIDVDSSEARGTTFRVILPRTTSAT